MSSQICVSYFVSCTFLLDRMTKNPNEDSICSRTRRLITEYEQSRDFDSTEIDRQFAVRRII